MNRCCSEGELRAYLDREMDPGELERVRAHTVECASCAAALAEIDARARRVSSLLDELSLPQPGVAPARVEVLARRPAGLRSAVAFAALAAAAGLVVAVAGFWGSGAKAPPASAVSAPAPPPARAFAPQATLPPAPPPQPAARRPARERAVAKYSRRRQVEYFLALDDEPIESGTILRVGLGPSEIPADVVFDPEGRARAIRLVSEKR